MQVAVEMPFDIKTIESPTHKVKIKVSGKQVKLFATGCIIFCFYMQRTSTMATVELCPGSTLGEGFQLLVGLAEIHVPRMWVEEDDKSHHVSAC